MKHPTNPLKMLIVDDQREVRRMIKAALEAQFPNATLVDVPSAEEAMVLLAQDRFNLLVVDVRLAGMSGLEMVEKARRRQPNLSIVVITGINDPTVEQQLNQAPIQAWFRKPIPMDEFLACASNLLMSEIPYSSPTQAAPPLSTEEVVQPKVNAWDGLCERLGLQAVWISDNAGKLLAQSTNTSSLPDFDLLVDYFFQVASAIEKLQSRYHAEESPFFVCYLCQNYAASQVCSENLKVFFLVDREQLPTQPLELQIALLEKGRDLLNALNEWRSYLLFENLPAAGSLLGQSVETLIGQDKTEVNIQSDLELETLLQNPSLHLDQMAQADEFWEQSLSAEDWAESTGQSHTLHFRQARQLGILPSEEDETPFKD
ncbi:MAG: response regulator [Anaerolineales bacterium]|nr:response regulator [Anaerolineales bacterium]